MEIMETKNIKKSLAKVAVVWYSKNAKAMSKLRFRHQKRPPGGDGRVSCQGAFLRVTGLPSLHESIKPLADEIAENACSDGQEEIE